MRTGIALGSNLGDSLANIRAARDLLHDLSTSPVRQALVYRTTPVDCPKGSPDFLNTVIEIAFPGTPGELLVLTQAFQKKLGRKPKKRRNAPRVIDIDILYMGDLIFKEDTLELPHPRISERRFVLQPLADIRPGLILPGHTRSISEQLRALPPEDPLTVAATIW